MMESFFKEDGNKALFCQKHQSYRIELLKIEDIQQGNNSNLLYCYQCQDEDEHFLSKNFILIQKIINQSQKEILSKWPPINDNKIIEHLQSNQKFKKQEIEERINSFFNSFTRDILDIIDNFRQSLITKVQTYSPNNDYILQKYKEISKINELKQIILDEKMDITQKEAELRDLLNLLQEEKHQNTQQLKNLLIQSGHAQQIINFDFLNQIKYSITNLIDYFFVAKEFVIDELDKLIEDKNEKVDELIKIIQKQSNYLSKEQLVFLKHVLNLILPIIESISFKQEQVPLKSEPKGILQNVSFTQTKYQNSNNTIQIMKKLNSEVNITTLNSSEYWVPCVSNIVIERHKKYLFRFKIQCYQNNIQFGIGLVRDYYKNHNPFNDNLACPLEYAYKRLFKPLDYNYGIQQISKGKDFQVNTKDELLEIKISIEDQILELTNYPKYSSQIALEESKKINLKEYNQLRLFLFIGSNQLSISLTDAYIVEFFDQ